MLFGQIVFIRKFYIVLYTWHDHWGKSLEQGNEVYKVELEYGFHEHLKTQRENQLQIKAK